MLLTNRMAVAESENENETRRGTCSLKALVAPTVGVRRRALLFLAKSEWKMCGKYVVVLVGARRGRHISELLTLIATFTHLSL